MTRHQLGRDVFVHTHSCGEGGIFVNAFRVETRSGVIAIDSTLTETESKALRRELDALHKPLLAVLVTHPHPDHVAGITNLVGRDETRIVATRSVLDLMRELEEPKRKQWTPVFGAEWVQRWTYPNTVVGSGDKLELGGVTFEVLDLGPGGDSGANAVWVLAGPERTAFLGDMVFEGTHSYVADGHLLAWLANLTRIERVCKGMEIVFPGHGVPGRPAALIAQEREYLLELAADVKELAGGLPAVSEPVKQEIEARVTARRPGAGLSFLISMSVDPIARELSGRR